MTRTPPAEYLGYIAYCYRRVLPDSMQDWVHNDLAGKGALPQSSGLLFRACWYSVRFG